MLLVDTREPRKLRVLLHERCACVERSLPCGDMWIVRDNDMPSGGDLPHPLCIVERKTVDDLYASLRDGRFSEQRQRMLEVGAERIVYILEGGALSHADPRSRQAMGALENLAVVHACGLIPTSCMAQTVDTLVSLVRKVTATKPRAETCPKRALSRAARVDATRADLGAWPSLIAGIPGVSAKMAQAIARVYPDATSLLADDGAQLESVRAENAHRVLGPSLAKRIRAAFGK